MPNQKIIITPFEKAIASLEDVLAQPQNSYMRDSAIQRFEYTFELAIKMIKRYFQEKGISDNPEALTYNDLCRMAAEAELIGDSVPWFDFRDARNKTSHAYDENLAEEVYRVIPSFLPHAKTLLQNLKSRV